MSKKNGLQAIILAAGKSKRFNTGTTKLLAPLCGKPMIFYILDVLKEINIPTTLVLGNDALLIEEQIAKQSYHNVSYAYQHEQHGTGHAVACSKQAWNQENIILLYGDMPLVTVDLLEQLIQKHEEEKATLTFASTFVLDPSGYGRIIDKDGKPSIIEDKECSKEERSVNQINAGIYVIKQNFLSKALDELVQSSCTGEYYITDIVGRAHQLGEKVCMVHVPYDSVRGVNTLQDLWKAEEIKRSEIIQYWMMQGVRFELPQTVVIEEGVTIESDTVIGSGVHLRGKTSIGKRCKIDSFSVLENVQLGNESHVRSHSVISNAAIESKCIVGPFAHIRENVTLANNSVVGNFVEIKKSTIGADSKIKHLSYIGNTIMGNEVNVGAGSIVCNYDGAQKHTTHINDKAFIGSNATLVAPLTIGENSFIAAGSTITSSVPKNDLAIARARQENKKEYASLLRNKKKLKNNDTTASTKTKKYFVGAYKTTHSSKENL